MINPVNHANSAQAIATYKPACGLGVDGVEQQVKAIPLVDDRQEHSVEVRIHAARS